MRSDTHSVEDYLSELPAERRAAVETVRRAILDNLPDGFTEAMNWGMIAYEVPIEVYPDTYNGKPLLFAALASQKHHMAVYLTAVYMDSDRRRNFEERYRKTGKRMDIGKSCVRFRKLEDLPVDLVGEVIGSMSIDEFVSEVRAASSVRKAKH